MRVLACALLASLWGCSPFGGGAFRCETDADCAGGPSAGRCETAVGFCSFEDSSCQSGYRYGTSSGGQSGVCVGDEMPIIDAPPNPDDGDVGDMSPMIDARTCFGTPHEICLTTLPTGPRTLPATINTDTDCDQVETPSGGVPLCVVSGTAITIDNTRAEGSRPLVIVATETIDITGNLDVSSKRVGNAGAGANAAGCNAATMGENDGGGAAGGGGGGFGASGGTAGFGDNNDNGGAAGKATGGVGGMMSVGAFIRGGCKGANGGSTNGGNNGSDNGTNFGAGSNGGGAVYLIAVTSITVQTTGTISASGGGGDGGNETSGGGGGGGSGGLIGFDAPTITVMGRVAANGGGGGGGGGNSDGGNGADGFQPGAQPNWNQRADGGASGQQANSAGGRGGTTGNLAGEGSNNSDGGSGGGGGGVGLIWVHGTLTGTQVSPPITAH